MSFPRYERYKDSGVEWLGEVPEHWSIFAGRRLFKNRRELASESDEQLAASQKYGVIPQSLMMELNDSKVMLALKGTESFRHAEKNDFVISLRSFEGGIEHSNYVGCVSPAYTVLNAIKTVDPNFYRYFFKSKRYISALQSTTDSLRDGKSITYQQFGNIPLVLPLDTEQQTIVAFLDRETAKIDALMAEQQRLIELLKEKRQAVISRAVTKGLNPEAKMKDSGIEWLGEVPEHWGYGALGYLSTIQTGSTPDRSKSEYWNGDIPWLKTGEVNYELITSAEEYITEAGLNNSSSRLANEGTLLMAMYGQGVTRGRVAILGIKASYNQACAAISLNERLNNEYTQYFFITVYDFIRDTGNETSQMNLSSGIICKIKVLLPPIREQLEIVGYLKQQTEKLEFLQTEAQTAINLLQERRTALIAAAVTGKIDVRGLTQCC